MTEPVVNRSIKAFSKLQGRPAVSRTSASAYSDWGSRQTRPNSSAKKTLFKAPTGYISPLKQTGINPQYLISLPFKEVNDLPNKRINRGKGRSFSHSSTDAKPYTGLSKIAFDPVMRIGKIGANLSQQPFTFSSFNV